MTSKLRWAAVACSISGGLAAVLATGPVHHTAAPGFSIQVVAAPSATPKVHHHAFLRAPRKLLSGVGSWYGEMFDGRATASGEIFDKDALTACHPTLPFGTLVRVINLRNRKSVVVRINDRGLRSDRVIDLSLAAADRIGLRETGLAPVRLIVLAPAHA